MSLVSINWNPSRQLLRQFGCAAALFALGWALALAAAGGWSAGPGVLAVVAGGALLCALLCPGVLLYPYLGLTLATAPVGWVMGQVLLGLMYYAVFTPLAVVFRLVGRDALGRRFERRASTYWTPRRPVRDVRQYLRQF